MIPSDRSRRFLPAATAGFGVTFFALLTTWVFAMPINSGPDENQVLVYAAAAVRNEVPLPLDYLHPIPTWRASVPGFIASSITASILEQVAVNTTRLPANPNDAVGNVRHLITVGTRVGHLPPFYYYVIGLPTLLPLPGLAVYFLARLVCALICAIFVALAIYGILKFSPTRRSVSGFLLAISPGALFLGAVVSANGIEIFAAAAMWVYTALLITSESDEDITIYKLWALTAGLLNLVRTVSPAWVLLAIVYLGMALGPRKLLSLALDARLRPYSLFVALTGLATGSWDLWKGQFPGNLDIFLTSSYYRLPFIEQLGISVSRFPLFLDQAFFKRLLLTYPALAAIWIALVFIGWLMALCCVSNRKRAILALVLLTDVLLPAIFEASQGSRLGMWWSGNYSDPLYVQTPIFAHIFCANPRRRTTIPKSLGVLARLHNYASVAAFTILAIAVQYLTIRIFMVGATGTLNVFDANHAAWATYPYGFQGFWLAASVITTALAIVICFSYVSTWQSTLPGTTQSSAAANLTEAVR